MSLFQRFVIGLQGSELLQDKLEQSPSHSGPWYLEELLTLDTLPLDSGNPPSDPAPKIVVGSTTQYYRLSVPNTWGEPATVSIEHWVVDCVVGAYPSGLGGTERLYEDDGGSIFSGYDAATKTINPGEWARWIIAVSPVLSKTGTPAEGGVYDAPWDAIFDQFSSSAPGLWDGRPPVWMEVSVGWQAHSVASGDLIASNADQPYLTADTLISVTS